MRLVCDSCGANFRMEDDLVKGRRIRFKCKKCGKTLEASGPSVEITRRPSRTSPNSAAARRGSTGSGHKAIVQSQDQNEPPPLPPKVWWVAIDGERLGPLSLAEMALRIRRGLTTGDDLVWRKGLGMWQPIIDVDELREFLNAPPVTSPPTDQHPAVGTAFKVPTMDMPPLLPTTAAVPEKGPAQPKLRLVDKVASSTKPAIKSKPSKAPVPASKKSAAASSTQAPLSASTATSSSTEQQATAVKIPSAEIAPISEEIPAADALLKETSAAKASETVQQISAADISAEPITAAPDQFLPSTELEPVEELAAPVSAEELDLSPLPEDENNPVVSHTTTIDMVPAMPPSRWFFWGATAIFIGALLGGGTFFFATKFISKNTNPGPTPVSLSTVIQQHSVVSETNQNAPNTVMSFAGETIDRRKKNPPAGQNAMSFDDFSPEEISLSANKQEKRGHDSEQPIDRIVSIEEQTAQQMGTKSNDLATAFASRIYRRNRSMLIACDRLADRRGDLKEGAAVAFKIKVLANGSANVNMQGHAVGESLLSCYRSTLSQWQYPIIQQEYETSFNHRVEQISIQ